MMTRDDIKTKTILSLIDTGLISELKVCQKGFVDKARNAMIEDFLTTNKTHLLWVDSDNILPANILSLGDLDADVVGGLAMTPFFLSGRTIWTPQIFRRSSDGVTTPYEMKELEVIIEKARREHTIPVVEPYMFGSSWLVRRSVYDKVVDEDGIWHRVTWNDPDTGRIRYTEDGYFFDRCHRAGLKVIARLDVRVGHVKTCIM